MEIKINRPSSLFQITPAPDECKSIMDSIFEEQVTIDKIPFSPNYEPLFSKKRDSDIITHASISSIWEQQKKTMDPLSIKSTKVFYDLSGGSRQTTLGIKKSLVDLD